jgi:vacuolar protein sorting-associated protein 13B
MNIQVDNQLYRSGGAYDFPVILCSGQEQQMDKLHQKLAHSTQLHDLEKILINDQSEPIFSVNLHFYKNNRENSIAIACGEADNDYNVESIHLKINPIRAYIEDTYINLLLDYLMESLPNQNLIYQSQQPKERESCVTGSVLVPDTVVQQAKYFSMPVRIKLFRIEPLNILLSVHTCMRLVIF